MPVLLLLWPSPVLLGQALVQVWQEGLSVLRRELMLRRELDLQLEQWPQYWQTVP